MGAEDGGDVINRKQRHQLPPPFKNNLGTVHDTK